VLCGRLFYLFQGRVKFVKVHQHDLEPTPNYDCHLMKVASIETSSSSPSCVFENSQVPFIKACIIADRQLVIKLT